MHSIFVVCSPIEGSLLVMCGQCGDSMFIDMDDLPLLPESNFINGADADLLTWIGEEHRKLIAAA